MIPVVESMTSKNTGSDEASQIIPGDKSKTWAKCTGRGYFFPLEMCKRTLFRKWLFLSLSMTSCAIWYLFNCSSILKQYTHPSQKGKTCYFPWGSSARSCDCLVFRVDDRWMFPEEQAKISFSWWKMALQKQNQALMLLKRS